MYYGKGTNILLAAADQDMGEGLGQPHKLTDTERLEQACILYEQMRQKAEALEAKIEQLEKGKGPGWDPLRWLGPHTDRFSIPCPDNFRGPPNLGPSGTYPIDRLPPASEVKLILIEKLEPFEGTHNNIERFLGDCTTYFEVFRWHYRDHPALIVVFATSLFKGATKDWWVHLRDDYQYTAAQEAEDWAQDSDEDDASFHGAPRYHFLNWETFTSKVWEQFRDPTIELVHKQTLLALKMMGPAYLFF